jgi:hypothetical protein
MVSSVRVRTYVPMRRMAAATEASVGAGGAAGTASDPSTSSIVSARSAIGGAWGDVASSQ